MEQIGSIILISLDYPMIENGLLKCDGSSVAVSDYQDLYEEIGNTYGGDEDNFNVPSMEQGDGFQFGIVFIKSPGPEDAPEESEPGDPTDDGALADRIAWGLNVVRQFRFYTLGAPDEDGLVMLNNLIDVKLALELGMLGAAAYLLENKPEDEILDSDFDENQTVRERFLNMILNEGPTP